MEQGSGGDDRPLPPPNTVAPTRVARRAGNTNPFRQFVRGRCVNDCRRGGGDPLEPKIPTPEERAERRAAELANPLRAHVLPVMDQLNERVQTLREARARPAVNFRALAAMESEWTRSKDFVGTIFFLGSQGGGKTSLLNLFLDKEGEPVEPTEFMDYSYATHPTGTDGENDVCRFWELGGDAREGGIFIGDPVSEYSRHGLVRFSVFIVLDLSKPISIWPVFQSILPKLKRGFRRSLSQLEKATAERVIQQLEERLTLRQANVPQEDRQFLDPSHVPVVIIGTKYDVFQNLPPDTVKAVSRVLRLASHIIGATLCFYSKDFPVLQKRFKKLVSHHAFNTRLPKGTTADTGALFIPAGSETFEKIFPACSPAQCTLDFCKSHIESRVGVAPVKPKPVNPALDPRFAEPDIDALYAAEMARLRVHNDYADDDDEDDE